MPDEKPKRTIDERLDAITETLELVASVQLVNEREIGKLNLAVSELNATVQTDAENIRSLARICCDPRA
jgi:hypothetical protein